MPESTADVEASRHAWFAVRRHLVEHRYRLGLDASDEFPAAHHVAGTPLLAPGTWLPTTPIPLTSITLEFDPDATFTGVTGREPAARVQLPLRHDGTHYGSYADTIADLAPPAVFEDRPTYRLIAADLTGPKPFLRLGRGTYFDSINTGEASAHEFTAQRLNPNAPTPLRSSIGAPWNPANRPTNIAISTLTIRRDVDSGESTFYLHWRDPAKVGHAGGLYQVVPSGIFQPSAAAPWNEQDDFSLWHNLTRELAEELAAHTEDYGSATAPIPYANWPFATHLTDALQAGTARAHCVGLGVDPLTFATDLLTVLSLDSTIFDTLFPDLPTTNPEGRLLTPQPFTPEVINTFTHQNPTQPAGAALLQLAWSHGLH
ncbi:hypothetical protein ACIBG5_18245 [Kribbella sp. NPDC050241]|uniref:hypothetical protein n=1 Tax=Kribbella sp. NPDC050241 TaxID=3364115 RepID=UPI0037A052CA